MKNKVKYILNRVGGYPSKIREIQFSFILSTGRTGTNFFEQFFNQNFKNVLSIHEPKPDFNRFAIEYYRLGFSKNDLKTNMLFHRRREIDHTLNQGLKNYIESNPFLSYLSPFIKEVFPNPKIVHIVRHPDTYIFSAINKDPDNSGRFFMTDQDHKNRLNVSDFKEKYQDLDWSKMNQFQRVCWHWSFINNHVYQSFKNDPNYLILRFEDLFIEKKIETINILIEFLDLKNDAASSLDQIISSLGEKRNQTESRIIKDFEAVKFENIDFYNQMISKEELLRYGY